MKSFLLFSCLLVFGASCKTTTDKNTCSTNLKSKRGTSLNPTRLQVGSPIIHDYMCLELVTDKMESWETPATFQKTAKTGFHAGKGIFLQSDPDLDEKDIYRHRLNDSTFETLGILTEVRNGKSSFPNIWYSTVSEEYLFAKSKSEVSAETAKEMQQLSITQADSILSAWNTSRR